MLPSEDALWVGEELARRFGLPRWQFALTATDANRFAIRLARHITGRPKVLVFNWCYHGTVDESFATLAGGLVVEREGNIGPPVPLDATTRVVEWNDPDALRARARAGRRRVRARRAGADEHRHRPPAAGLPRDAARADAGDRDAPDHRRDAHALRRPGRLHAGARARARPAHRRQGDRRAASPAAAYGFSAEVADRIEASIERDDSPTSAASGARSRPTSSRSPPMRATLEHVLTEEAFAHMIALGERFERGVQAVIDEHALPWHVTRLGCRVEYLFRAGAARDRERGRRRRRSTAARPAHPPVRAQPRHPADAVPQHGADVARPRPRPTSTSTPRCSARSARELTGG